MSHGGFEKYTDEQLVKKLEDIDKKIPKCTNHTLLWMYENSIKCILAVQKERKNG